MLKEVELTRRTWCGAYALATLTGKPVDLIEDHINRYRKKKLGSRVARTDVNELRHVFKMLGQDVEDTERLFGGMTFARWLRERSPEQRKAKYLVLVTNHWVAVQGNKMNDTWVKAPTFIRRAPHRRKRMQLIIKLT